MKNLSRYDENLSVPRKQDVDDKQAKIDVDGILQGDGNGNISAAETTQTGAVPIPVGIMKGAANGSIEAATPGTDYALQSLGMSGATVGQVPTVKTIDAQGRPVEWEPANLGGSDVFIISIVFGSGGTSVTTDRTYEEVNSAILSNKMCYCKHGGIYFPLTHAMTTKNNGESFVTSANFSGIDAKMSATGVFMMRHEVNLDTTTWTINEFQIIQFSQSAKGGQIPSYGTDTGNTGWKPTNIDTSLATDFTGIIKGADGKLAQAEAGTDYMAPVAVTTADNGKFLRVVDGAWAAVSISDANGVSF